MKNKNPVKIQTVIKANSANKVIIILCAIPLFLILRNLRSLFTTHTIYYIRKIYYGNE